MNHTRPAPRLSLWQTPVCDEGRLSLESSHPRSPSSPHPVWGVWGTLADATWLYQEGKYYFCPGSMVLHLPTHFVWWMEERTAESTHFWDFQESQDCIQQQNNTKKSLSVILAFTKTTNWDFSQSLLSWSSSNSRKGTPAVSVNVRFYWSHDYVWKHPDCFQSALS